MFSCKFCSIWQEHLNIRDKKGKAPFTISIITFIGVSDVTSKGHIHRFRMMGCICLCVCTCLHLYNLTPYRSRQIFFIHPGSNAHFIPSIPGWLRMWDSFDPHSSIGCQTLIVWKGKNILCGDTLKSQWSHFDFTAFGPKNPLMHQKMSDKQSQIYYHDKYLVSEVELKRQRSDMIRFSSGTLFCCFYLWPSGIDL